MTGRQVEEVTRADVDLATVVHHDVHRPGQHVAEMAGLARLRAYERPDVGREPPPRLERALGQRGGTRTRDDRATVRFELAYLAVTVEIADLSLRHTTTHPGLRPDAGRGRQHGRS